MKFFALLIGTCLWASIATARQRGEEVGDSSNQIAAIMGIDGFYTPLDQEFVEKFTDYGFTNAQRMDMLNNLKPIDLVEFLQNPTLQIYRTQALDAYGANYGMWRIYVKDRSINNDFKVFQNEIVFKNLNILKEFVTPIATKAKSLVLDFKHLVDGENGITSQLEDGLKKLNETNMVPTVEQLELRCVFGNEYESLDKFVFEKVQELSVTQSNSTATFDLKKLFPNVIRLSLAYNIIHGFDWSKTNYTQLTHLIADKTSNASFDVDSISDALQANAALSTLGVIDCSPRLLHEIANYPNIKTLGIKGYTLKFAKNAEVIRLENIERLYFDEGKVREIVKNIEFSNLKELHWRSEDNAESKLVTFISNHAAQLKTITIENAIVTDDDLEKLKNLDALEEVTFIFDPKKPIAMTGAGLAKFITGNSNPTSKLSVVRLVTKDKTFLMDVDTVINNGLPAWTEFFSQPMEVGKTIYVKDGKAPATSADNFIFFKDYF